MGMLVHWLMGVSTSWCVDVSVLVGVLARDHTGTRRVDVGVLVLTEEGTVLEGRQCGSSSPLLQHSVKKMTVSVKATLAARRGGTSNHDGKIARFAV